MVYPFLWGRRDGDVLGGRTRRKRIGPLSIAQKFPLSFSRNGRMCLRP